MIKLYKHTTDGGAEYLMDTFIKCKGGHKEGVITDKTRFIIRLDGEQELNIVNLDVNKLKRDIKKIENRLVDMQYESDEEYYEDCNDLSYYRGRLSVLN